MKKSTLAAILLVVIFTVSCNSAFGKTLDLDKICETNGVVNDWGICKDVRDGDKYIKVQYNGNPDEENERLSYMIFSDPSSAKKNFETIQSSFSEYIEEEGKNWFITWLPYMPDMSITRMYYRKDNVIIYCDIESHSTWGDDSGQADSSGHKSGNYMKNYITENAGKIRRFAVDLVSEIP